MLGENDLVEQRGKSWPSNDVSNNKKKRKRKRCTTAEESIRGLLVRWTTIKRIAHFREFNPFHHPSSYFRVLMKDPSFKKGRAWASVVPVFLSVQLSPRLVYYPRNEPVQDANTIVVDTPSTISLLFPIQVFPLLYFRIDRSCIKFDSWKGSSTLDPSRRGIKY